MARSSQRLLQVDATCLLIITILMRSEAQSGVLQSPEAWFMNHKSCGQTSVTNGSIKTNDCYGNAELATLDHFIILPCEKLGDVIVHGPMILNFNHCSIFEVGLPICHPGIQPDLFGLPRCPHGYGSASASLIVVLILSTLVHILTWRFFWIRIKFVPKGYVSLYRTDGMLSFTITAKRDEAKGLVFNNPQEEALFKPTHYDRERFYINWRILLLLLFFIQSKSILPAPSVSAQNIGVREYSHTLYASEGDVVTFNGITMKITQAHYLPHWTSAYWTMPFSATIKADWHCTDVCDSGLGKCYEVGPFGHWSDKISSYKDNDKNKPIYSVDYCLPGTTGCFANNGCWKWTIDFRFDLTSRYNIMTLVDFRPILTYEILSNARNRHFEVSMNKPLIWNHDCIARASNGDYYHCGQCSFNSYPEAGKIGEVQAGLNDSVIASHDLSSCEKDNVKGPVCSVQNSSLENHIQRCDRITGEPTSGGFSISNGWLTMTRDGSVTIRFLSDDPDQSSSRDIKCGGPVLDLWAAEHSGKIAKLHIKSRMPLDFEYMSVPIHCLNSTLMVPCDRYGRLIDVPWPNDCLSGTANIKKHISDSRLVDYRASTTLHYIDKSSGLSFGFSDWVSSFHLPSLFSFLGINTIIIIIGALFICRK